MGRRAKPVDLLVLEGKSHLTQDQIRFRKENELRLGSQNFKIPDYVKSDPVAEKKWREVVKVYKDSGLDIASTSDVSAIVRYCLCWSEYLDLRERRERLGEMDIEYSGVMCELPEDARDQITDLIKLGPLISLENAIQKKSDHLIKLEDRLFLNPLAKIKNIPKPLAEQPEDDEDNEMFGE